MVLAIVLGIASALSCSCRREDGAPAVAALRGLSLIDQDGVALNDGFSSDHLLLLNFMFSRCPGPCPRITQLISETHRLLPDSVRGRVHVLSVSVDPEYDSPKTLKTFAQAYRADVPWWRFVSISDADLKIMSERLVVFAPNEPRVTASHSTKIYLFDRNGRVLQRYDGNVIDAPYLARELASADRQP